MNRHQLSRQTRLPPRVRSVARPTRWGNPFRVGDTYPVIDLATGLKVDTEITAPDLAVDLFRTYATHRAAKDPAWLEPLTEVDGLACWCPVDQVCHADVLIDILTSSRSTP